MQVLSVHERHIQASPEQIGRLLDTLSSPGDRLWPTQSWPAQQLDRPLSVGAAGGHGPIRYVVESYLPGRLVRYRFDRIGLAGHHWFVVEPHGDGATIRHVIHAEAGTGWWLRWHLLIRWMHDALIEEAFDRAQSTTMRAAGVATRRNAYVRAVRWAFARLGRRAGPRPGTGV